MIWQTSPPKTSRTSPIVVQPWLDLPKWRVCKGRAGGTQRKRERGSKRKTEKERQRRKQKEREREEGMVVVR